MGLDVYLYRHDDLADSERREAEYERLYEAEWSKIGEYSSATDEQKSVTRTACKEIALRLGLGEYGEDIERSKKIELPSTKHPDHMFKIGYFRSSYNEGGIDRHLHCRLGVTLNNIFGANDKYIFQPDWNAALNAAQAARDGLAASLTETPFVISTIDMHSYGAQPTSDEEAMAIVSREFSEKRHLASYSNRDGHWFRDEPIKVLAMIPGRRWNEPCMFVACEATDMDWYVKAMDVVVETCEWVISQPDRDKYYLHWSS